MGRIMAIDFGTKRVGIAVTDPQQIFASPLKAVGTEEALSFIEEYCRMEEVETIVIGLPFRLNGKETHATRPAINFGKKLEKKLPKVVISYEDEQFSSKDAVKVLVRAGTKKKDRRKKENIDKVSAALILQSYLENK